MFVLLRHRDPLWRLVTHLHGQAAVRRGDRQVAVAQPSNEVEGLLGGLLHRQALGVRGHLRLDGGPHVRRGSEVAIGRHLAVQRLVGPLEVVVLHVQVEPPHAVGEIGKHGA
jgi:hypothetical protein